jgi:hypothetical protein
MSDDKELHDACYKAMNEAIRASNYLHNAMSWCRPVDPEEDDRDPENMRKSLLAEAEVIAENALAMIRSIRATQSN